MEVNDLTLNEAKAVSKQIKNYKKVNSAYWSWVIDRLIEMYEEKEKENVELTQKIWKMEDDQIKQTQKLFDT